MRILILGAGAIGSLIGSFLARSGIETLLVDSNHARLEDLRRNGVRLVGFRGDHVVPVPTAALETLVTVEAPDTVLVCVRPGQLETAVQAVLPLCDISTTFVPFLGGLAPLRLAEIVSPERTVLAVANFEGMLRADGAVEAGFHNFVWLGEPDHRYSERLQVLQQALTWVAPTLTTQVIQGMIWSKALYSLEVALSSLVAATPGEVYAQADNRRLAAAVVREGIALADKVGIEPIAFDFFDPNLYRAASPGQARVTDIWIHHAWLRHEQFRVGLDYVFPPHTGLSWSLSPVNPHQEASQLFADLTSEADRLDLSMPLLHQLQTVFNEVHNGQRPQDQANLDRLLPLAS